MAKLGTIEILDPIVVRILRSKSPEERIQQAYGSNRLVRQRLASHFAYEHPEWSAQQINKAVAERLLHGTVSPEPHSGRVSHRVLAVSTTSRTADPPPISHQFAGVRS